MRSAARCAIASWPATPPRTRCGSPTPRERTSSPGWRAPTRCRPRLRCASSWRRPMPVDPTRLHIPAGTGGDGSDPLVLTPERCGWRFAGLRVFRLAAGERRALETGDDELAIVPLQGGCAVEVEGRRLALEGRSSVFDRVTDVVYLPSGTEAAIVA